MTGLPLVVEILIIITLAGAAIYCVLKGDLNG